MWLNHVKNHGDEDVIVLVGDIHGIMIFFVTLLDMKICDMVKLPSGEQPHSNGKIHHFSWENPLFLWPFSIAMLVHQRVHVMNILMRYAIPLS